MLFSKKSLGIDIGAKSIKIVEVSSFGEKKKLENYVEFQLPFEIASVRVFDEESLLLLSDVVAEILLGLFKKLNIKQRKAALALPDFSTFFTTFTLPPMTEREIPQAIEFEARHHIPLPLSDVTFDWQVVEREEVGPGVKLKVLLVAVPNRVLESYQRLATLCQIEVKGLEAEVFGLIRAAIPRELEAQLVCLVDFGWQSTTVSVVENKNLILSHSFDISGTSLTKDLSSALNISLEKAETLKREYGLDPKREDVSRILIESINSLSLEVANVCQNFYQAENKEVKDIILSGGTAFLFGLREYLASRIKKNVQFAQPFAKVSCPAILEERLKAIGPSFAVALGVGMMGAES